MTRLVARAAAALLAAAAAAPAAPAAEPVDTALVLAVDVSGSVDADRYTVQMEGIARTFEDDDVVRSILAGPHRAMLATLVEWSEKAHTAVPWTRLASHSDIAAFAQAIRLAPRVGAEFTCMSQALQTIGGKILPFMPAKADRTVVDVSGDGHDNCNPPTPVDAVRDELVAEGVTINGLPILSGNEAATLEAWYRDHVIGGPAGFLVPAQGFGDFHRAMRRKFIVEISRR